MRPLQKVDSKILAVLKRSLESTFNGYIEIKPEIDSLDYAYDATRQQYLASRLLVNLGLFNDDERCLGIVKVDLYAYGLDFIFGQADVRSGVAIISLYSLGSEYDDLPEGGKLLQERVVKEAIYELGHIYHLGHCQDRKCVMHFSNSLADTDMKTAAFCSQCRQKLIITRE